MNDRKCPHCNSKTFREGKAVAREAANSDDAKAAGVWFPNEAELIPLQEVFWPEEGPAAETARIVECLLCGYEEPEALSYDGDTITGEFTSEVTQ